MQAKAEGAEGENQLFFCEHEPVLTIGKSGKETKFTDPRSILERAWCLFLSHQSRGRYYLSWTGTDHGYPVFDLAYWSLGLRQYIELLEEAVIRFLALYGLNGERLAGATGVWLDPLVPGRARKICAIGVKSSRFVTMHGFALNINTDLSYFRLINPCGFTDK